MRRGLRRRWLGGRALRGSGSCRCLTGRTRRCSPLGRSTRGAQRPLGGFRDGGDGVVPAVEGLAGRGPGCFAAGPDRGCLASGELLGQQGSDGFGGVPALSLRGREQLWGGGAHVREPQLAQQVDDIVGGVRDGAHCRTLPTRNVPSATWTGQWGSSVVDLQAVSILQDVELNTQLRPWI